MSDEPSAPPDLADSANSAFLGAIDLSLSFAPAWAKDADTSKQIARLAAKHGGEDRADRPGAKRWEDRGPRQDRRPPRGAGGGARPDKRAGRNDSRRPEPRPEREPRPEPAISGWEVQFAPDRHGVDGLARQIKASAKAYPLFDLARLVLEKSERYLVHFKRTSDSPTPLFQLKTDGSLWLAESEAVAHALARQFDKFYRRERISTDPPKGVFPFVAVCGMSGTLLGPPNYHDYQTKLRELHASRFANVPFEVFKGRIRMERDEASIARWKEEQSAKDVFYPVDPNAPVPDPAPASVPETESPAPAPSVPASEDAPASDDIPASDDAEASDDTPAAEDAAPIETPPEPEAIPVPAPANDAEKLATLADVERHFRQHHASSAIVKIRDRVVVPGPAALNDSAPAVLQLTRGAWEELSRFPLSLAHTLGQQLVGKGLQIFKTPDKITCVGVARPRYLDRQATPVSEALSGILDYLEGHASTPRPEQLQALLALRPATEADPESALARDLSWLLHEGHAIDFAKRGLEAARRPKPRVTAPPAEAVAPSEPVLEPGE